MIEIKKPQSGIIGQAILTIIDGLKWINDFALTKLLEYYYNKCKELENRKTHE